MRYNGQSRKEVIAKISKIRQLDVSWDRVLNSICSPPHKVSVEAFIKGIDVNLGDPRIFKESAKIEVEIINSLGKLLGCEFGAGNITSGGTEANLLAIYVAKKLRKDIENPEVIFPETAHFSLYKVVELMGLKYHIAEVDEQYKAKPMSIKKLINKNTIAIISTAGTSEFGTIDPIEEIAGIAKEHNIYFHVDAATGGFIIPFASQIGYHLPKFDFSIEGVSSITIDPHKYGLVPIPAGGIIFRNKELHEKIKLDSYFVNTPSHTTLIGTRSGAPILATYAIIEYLGQEGFIKITKENFEKTAFLVDNLKQKGFQLVVEPELNIVTFKVKDANYLLSEFGKKGWIISVSKRHPDAIRLVINYHVSKSMIIQFLNLLDKLMNGGMNNVK